MAVQLDTTLRSNRLDRIETDAGNTAKLQIRTLAQPANCGAADAGALLCEMTLPSDWMNAASGGQKTLLGTWQGTASGGGVAAHFRLKNNAGSTTYLQGSVGQGTGDLQLDNTTIANGQTVTITQFTLTDGNA